MRSRFQLLVALTLCAVATGSQWDVLQVVGWGRMVMTYSRTMSVSQAVSKTFSGEMCDICRLVNAAGKADHATNPVPEVKAESKALLFCHATPRVIFFAPVVVSFVPTEPTAPSTLRSAPPVPPPRAELA